MADETLFHLAGAVADRTPIDWDAVRSDSTAPPPDIVAGMQLLAGLARLHAATGGDEEEPAPDEPFPDAERWGHLRLLESIGEGAFGHVYRAWDTHLDREVALKLMDVSVASSRSDAIAEARLLARVRHPNIVTVHGADTHDGRVGLWMEFIHGRTAGALVESAGPYGAREAAGIGLDLCRALAAVHLTGLVHRDVKAQNVMREVGGRVVLMDFGTTDTAAATSGLAGTPLYLPAEVLSGQRATPATDLYSLGILLFHLLTGAYPVLSDSVETLVAEHLAGRAQRLRDLRPDLPESLIEIVERAISVDPVARFRTAAAFESALSGFLAVETGAIRRPTRWLNARRVAVLALLTITGGLAAASRPWKSPPSGFSKRSYQSLGVLPFKYSSDTGETADFLADGFTEEMISGLSHIPNLRLTSRTSVMAFKNSPASIPEIAKTLGVDLVLEGSITRDRGQLRGRVTLVDRDGRIVSSWTQQGPEDRSGYLHRQLVELVAYEFDGRGADALEAAPDVDGTAWLDYLRARHQLNKRTSESCLAARDLFERAIGRQPDFARAYAGLGEAYLLAGAFGWLEMADVFPKAEAAAHRALDLDPTLAEPHAVLAYRLTSQSWPAAQHEYLKAIELNPNYATARQWYALSLMRNDQAAALAQMELAARIDPLSPIIGSDLAVVYKTAGRIEDAVEQLYRVIKIHPGFGEAHRQLGELLEEHDRMPEALAAFEKGAIAAPDEPLILSGLAAAYGRAGKSHEAKALFDRMRALARRQHVASIWMMTAAAAAGDAEAAIGYGQEGLNRREGQTVEILGNPNDFRRKRLSSLDSVASYRDLLKDVAVAFASRSK